MGEANRRGSRAERVALAEHRARTEAAHRAALPASVQEAIDIEARCGVLFSGLTTPSSINEQVLQFARTLSATAPSFLDCMPEAWSRQSCCNMNVARYVEDNGGRMVCGYRIWYNEPLYIEGERHAVWADGDTIRDVSFVDTGETRTLFVPDEKAFDEAPQKVRLAFRDEDKSVLAGWEAMMSMVPVQVWSPEESWDSMPTYEQWLAGKRMPNLIPAWR
ncbi:hypothetical protein PCO31110_04510 [Pandoraea communis]|uniref:Uncharacterized protein n=1 Tax=Pandoraea communis TaxID=2508297 RepID=A0A5E4YEG9_9BURK|nr:hypothetical protein [Pandoraea communis]VVE46788.1 hypothetical protein PCO31110_04510 [Pandoraea communis]